ncbi:MAG: hypothetical protein JNM27_00390 [Leptospirales bacterium]|nr:hypothetical protein [Leptospirales bacterium]
MISVGRLTPLVLILLGVLFLLARSNLGGIDRTYIFSDIVTYEYPMQKYFHNRVMNGELPLWNPYISSGNPVIGTLQARLLYPPHLLLTILLGLEVGQFIEILFHFFLGMIGSYAMLRSFRFGSPISQWGAGVCTVRRVSKYFQTIKSPGVRDLVADMHLSNSQVCFPPARQKRTWDMPCL